MVNESFSSITEMVQLSFSMSQETESRLGR
jgi:hypothetical protein